MNDEPRKLPPPPPRFPEQDENGVDLSLIRENLKLSVSERLRKADRAYQSYLRVREIGRQNREKPT